MRPGGWMKTLPQRQPMPSPSVFIGFAGMQMRRQIEAIFNSTGLLNIYRNTTRTSWSLRPQDA